MSVASEIAGRVLGLPAPETTAVEVVRDLRVTMDDGAVLLADRYAPRGGGPRPTVLVRSPYGRGGAFGLLYGRLFAERGFQAVVQSVRGTAGSGGRFSPFDERADGLATLAWLERQPFHEGRVGMVGASYLGVTQWAVAREAGERIGALALSSTASRVHGQAFGGGSISLETALAWTMIIAAQDRRLGMPRLLTWLRRLPRLLDQLPIGRLDAVATGRALPFFSEWMQHTRADDPYWAARDFSAGVPEVSAPAHFVGGWHDIFLPWMLEDHHALEAAGRAPHLVIGPWTHMSAGMLGAGIREALAWLRHHLLDDPRLLDGARVRIFVSGDARWRTLPAWPPRAQPVPLHLQPRGGLAAELPPHCAPDRYRYDPARPTPSVGGPGLLASRPVVDNRELEARQDVLTYTTEPLPADLLAIGPVEVQLHARSDLEHFDLFARVCDVAPDGESRNVCDALERVAPGRFERARDGTVLATFALWPMAHRFAAGHRVRLQVSSGAHPRYARNTGTGEDPADATRLEASAQEILHDPRHPSHVRLPHVPEPGST